MANITDEVYAQDILGIFRTYENDLFKENDTAIIPYNADLFNQSLRYVLRKMKDDDNSIIRGMERYGTPVFFIIDCPWDDFNIDEANFITILEMVADRLSNNGYSANNSIQAYNNMLAYGLKKGFVQNNLDQIKDIFMKAIDEKFTFYMQKMNGNPNNTDYKLDRHFHNVLDTYNSICFLCPDILLTIFEKYPDRANANELRTWTLANNETVRLAIVDTISESANSKPTFFKLASLLYANNAVIQNTLAYETLFAAHINKWPITVHGLVGNLGKKLGTAWLDDFLNAYFGRVQNLDKALQDPAQSEGLGDLKPFYESFLIENFKAFKNIILEKNKRARTPNAFFVDMAFTIANRLHRFDEDIYTTLVEPVFEKNEKALIMNAEYCHGKLKNHPHFNRAFFLPYMLKGFQAECDKSNLSDVNAWYKEYEELLPITLEDCVREWPLDVLERNQSTIGHWISSSSAARQNALARELIFKWVNHWDESSLSFFSINYHIRQFILAESKENPEMFRKIASTLCVEFFEFIDGGRSILTIPYQRYEDLSYANIKKAFEAYLVLPGFKAAWNDQVKNYRIGNTFLGAILSALGASLNSETQFDGHGMVEIFIKNTEAKDLVEKKKIFTQILTQSNVNIDESVEILF